MKKKHKANMTTILFIMILVMLSCYPLLEKYVFNIEIPDPLTQEEQERMITRRTELLVKGKLERLKKKWGRRLDYMIVLSKKALKYHQWIDSDSSGILNDNYNRLVSCSKVKNRDMMTQCFDDIYKQKSNVNLADSFKHLLATSLKLLLEPEEAISIILEDSDREVFAGFKKDERDNISKTNKLYQPRDSYLLKKIIKENGVEIGTIKFVYTYKSLETTTKEVENILRLNLK